MTPPHPEAWNPPTPKQVGNRWRRGVIFARYERRWFDAIVYIVDTLARRVLISYLGTLLLLGSGMSPLLEDIPRGGERFDDPPTSTPQHNPNTGWPKSTPNPRNGPLAEEWISFESPRLRRLSLPPAAAAGATAARSAQRASDEGEGNGGEWSVGDRLEVLIDQKDDDNRCVGVWLCLAQVGRPLVPSPSRPHPSPSLPGHAHRSIPIITHIIRYVYWRYQGAYARGVMGREDGPLECTLGVNVLPLDACPEEDGEREGEQQPVAAAAAAAASPCTLGLAGQSGVGESGNPPEGELVAMQGPAERWSWGNVWAFSSTSSAASSDGSSSTSGIGSGSEGWSPLGAEQQVEGEGKDEAPLFVFVKASSPNLAPQGTHLKACPAKGPGLATKPPTTPAALPLGVSAALAQPLLFPPVTV